MLKFTISWITITVIFFVSCGKQTEVHLPSGKVRKYRKNINPAGKVSKFSQKEQRHSYSFSEAFALWQVSHKTLTQSLNKGYLAVLENHRRTTGYLLDMGWLLPPWQQSKIDRYVKLYENLLRQKQQKVRQRTLKRKYRQLQKNIQKDLGRFYPKKKY